MIILKHLTIERFRLLREINLHFPQRGSILIQGPNEAGKTALLESIYFALYGEPLAPTASDRKMRSLDDLVFYGAAQAAVTLTLSIGATEMTISRSIVRGKGQQVNLQVRRLGMPEEEPIIRLHTANERIINELGYMDGGTLRNSCFIEQKGLNRLEELSGYEREAAIRKLLGLEKLLSLTEQFKLTPNDERMLLESTERLQLAETQAHIPELSQQLGQLDAALDAVTITEDLSEISQQEADIAEQKLSLEQLQAKRAGLKGHLSRIQQLQKADTTLGGIIECYDAIAEAQRELPELNQQIAELDRREREELPAIEKRVNELTDLIRSFGTLERMSNDLLTSVSTIKKLENELKEYKEFQEENNSLDEQVITMRLRLDDARQSLHELEEGRRASRPQLEARLQRLQGLLERLNALRQAEQVYIRRIQRSRRGEAEGDILRGRPSPGIEEELNEIQQDILDAEREVARLENEANQAQQKVDALEKQWRELSLMRRLGEWQRLKGQSQDLAEAEQHVMAAYQNQERLTLAAVEARQTANKWLMLGIGAGALGLIMGIFALFAASLIGVFLAVILALFALLCLVGAGWSWFKYNGAHEDAQVTHRQMQDAISQVGRMVAARETAIRTGGNRNAFAQVEQEIRALGGTIPRSREEAQYLLQQLAGSEFNAAGEDGSDDHLADLQQQLTGQRNTALVAQSLVKIKEEALAALRIQQEHLKEQRSDESWEDMETTLRTMREGIADKQYEVAALAGQEGLPIPSFAPPPGASGVNDHMESASLSQLGNLEKALAVSVEATQQEIASLDGKFDRASDLASRVKEFQEALDILLAGKQKVIDRQEYFRAHNPHQQLEHAREQQVTLRTALQTLQDSLRNRVKLLGVAFGQAAVSNAEAAARKQLESLQLTLGKRVELQSRRSNYTAVLKDRQDSLPEHYNQLAKFSGSLGSWIVPPNPFAETLAALRARCQQEIKEANENKILQDLEKLHIQESASNAKIALCHHDIEEAQERIAAILVQRNRPAPKGFNRSDIVAVWPLVGEYIPQDRQRLLEERASLEQALQQLEQQELELSTRLQTGSNKLDLEQARHRKEQQERSYQTRKRGHLMLNATCERVLRKMLPRTEYYLQHILPLLTAGRYHDVHLTTEEELSGERTLAVGRTVSGGPFQLRIWDTAAGAYIHKSALSGGAADQLSLALRLAFAVAVLPRELAAAPGFLLLDEPLSSSDRGRTQALADIITGATLGQHFEQILLVSHSSAFDPTMFPYHLYLDGGVIVASNLPKAPPIQVTESNGHDESSNNNRVVSATPIPASITVDSY